MRIPLKLGEGLTRRSFVKGAAVAGAAALSAGALTGCGGSSANTNENGMRTDVKIGCWTATTCDCSTIAALVWGFFEEEGLNPEMVVVDYNTWPAQVSTGAVDIMMDSGDSFNAMCEGAELTLVNGSHTGCSSCVVKAGSGIKTQKDLVGKAIGIDAIGGLGQVLCTSWLMDGGVDPKDVEFKVYEYSAFPGALENEEIAMFNYWDPIPQQLIDEGKAELLFRMNDIVPYQDLVCCYEGIASKVVENEPELAKALDRAFRKGTEMCRDKPEETAKKLIEQKYLAESAEFTAKVLASYSYWTDPAQAGESFNWWLHRYQECGIISQSVDVEEAFSKRFQNIDEL